MPDLSAFAEALRRGFGEIPPVAIAIALLAGPTAALVGYRFLTASRRLQSVDEVQAAPYWVCYDCRSINELRHSRCYHCHQERDRQEELEVIVDAPNRAPGYFEAPAGSPFAALGQGSASATSPGVPVMGPAADAVAVGPGRPTKAADALPSSQPAVETTDELAPATKPNA